MKRQSSLHPSERYLPDLGDIQTVFMLVLFVQLLAFVLELADGSSTPLSGLWSDLGLKSIFILWIALVSAVVIYPMQAFLSQCKEMIQGLIVFAIVQTVTLLVSWIIYDYMPQQELILFTEEIESIGEQYFRNIAISSIVSALLLHYLYIQSQWRKQVRAESEARLDALQSRMRPHFLFNSLNTIANLCRVDPDVAEDIVLSLAELFRACLKSEARLVPLIEELSLIHQYLRIEKQRLDERLRFVLDLDALPQDALVPPFSLQPLIENAIYHGLELASEGGELAVQGQLDKDKITIIVRNSIPEQQTVSTRPGNGLAVESIRTRLQSSFPDQSQLFISTVEGVYQVRLVFPYVTDIP
ncbi:MAG: histidine kinase [Methylococcales bacterium]